MPRLHNLVNNDELKRRLLDTEEPRTTLSFYKYHHIENPQGFRDALFLRWTALGVFGRIYIAAEGINGQISVPSSRFEAFRDDLYSIPFLQGIRLNIAVDDDGKSFYKLKIKVRSKIVADGLNDEAFDVTKRGKHLNAAEYNALTDQPDTIVVDMRNYYESEVGYFENAIRPEVDTFREALPLVEDLLADKKDNNIVMYCTGGIRCEKASAYYLHKGFKNVFMVDGGIIEYSRQCKEQGLPNKFLGINFVFDERLGERISEDIVSVCHQCGAPCDTHINCVNDACHLLFIQCPACAEKFEHCCSSKCRDFVKLPEEEKTQLRPVTTFNGTLHSNGHYRAFRRHSDMMME